MKSTDYLANAVLVGELLRDAFKTLLDAAAKNGRIELLIVCLLIVGLAYWRYAKRHPGRRQAGRTSSWGAKSWATRFGIAMATVCVSTYALKAMMHLDGSLSGPSSMQQFALVVVMPRTQADGIIMADAALTDQGGRFGLDWVIPADYRCLFLSHQEDNLSYSIGTFTKGWFPATTAFPVNTRSMPFYGTSVDKFVFDSSNLPSEGFSKLDQFLKAGSADFFYLVLGHTDSVGGPGHNKRLGRERAKISAMILETMGVPRNHIIVASMAADFPSGGSAAMDRRIQVIRIPNPFAIPSNFTTVRSNPSETAVGQN